MQEQSGRAQDTVTTIPQMVDDVREGKLPRRRFILALAALGISATGISAIVAAVSRPAIPKQSTPPSPQEQQHLDHHDNHITKQSRADIDQLHHDYAEHAIVEDSLHDQPFVGRAAIMARKSMGFAAVTDAQITITNRVVQDNQVTVEWVATGMHTGDLPGLPATNLPYVLQGVTVVVREEGKIVREALYFDAKDFRRQLTPVAL
jgi:steroid delta-isomerase-like uncharacterized protein